MKKISFRDFITLQRGFDLPRNQMTPGPYPVTGSTSIIGYHNEYKVEPPGVITGRSGSLGVLQYLTEPYWPHNTALWVRDFKGNEPKYVYYFLQTLDLKRFNSGVGVPTLNRNDLDNLQISIHDIPTQQKIAAILSAYDDLIENNTRRIRVLEAMAQAIYREWFVEFRYPGHEGVRLVESPLGPIPEGWEWVKFADILNSYSGGDWGEEEENEQEKCHVYIIRGADFRTLHNGGTIQAPRRFISTNSLIKRNLRPGDIIIENSVNASSRCIGSSFLVTRGILNRFRQDAICASFCKNFRLNDPDLASLVYLHLKYLYASQKMAFYQHIATNGIGNFQAERFVNSEYVPLPKDHELLLNLCKQLDAFVSSVFADQIFNLRQQRDMLLPRLISGELDVEALELPTL